MAMIFFSRLNCLPSIRTRNKLKYHKKVCKNKDFGSKDTKILEFNQYQESYKTLSLIYADLESLIKRIDGCKNKFEKSSTKTIGGYIPRDFSMFTIS